MSLSPLAEQIYRALVQQARQPQPLITYGELVRIVGALPTPNSDLKPNDQRLYDALEEIIRTCKTHDPPLPVLTSIVVRRAEDGSLGMPGLGYFTSVFPDIRDEAVRQGLWREEVRRVASTDYPDEPISGATHSSRKESHAFRPLKEPTVLAAIIGLVGTILTVVATVWISARRNEPPRPGQADSPVDTQARQNGPHLGLQADQANQTQSEKISPIPQKSPNVPTLDEILDTLEKHQQRATFGAVAGLLGREPQTLFNGYARTPRTAWVVSKSSGLPTGTKEADYPPGLLKNHHVIETPEDLRIWLNGHR